MVLERKEQTNMHTYAIWQNHRVIGYIGLTANQRDQLNGLPNMSVYFGFDDVIGRKGGSYHD